ncbi:LysR family transcriptional regulator [Neisseriaceae bacterium PsAf]|nr:LysR family transcriptional regulator [Neisseriaceae bacterium PsAf]MCV2503166.1 LysR family transcriptional regulator [Neisseriaceae bacterium]
MSSKLEIKHLKTIKAIHETGSLTRAAERLFTTQSALSHQIKALESYFDLSLFERKKQPIQLNQFGYQLLKLADEILPLVNAVETELMHQKTQDTGEMRIAVECHTCYDWLIPAMDDFRSYWPHVELDIVSGFQTDPIGLLLSNRADVAILSKPEPNTDIRYEPLFAYEMVAILAKNHALAEKPFLEAKDFKDETLITYPVEDDMLDLLRKVLIPENIFPHRRYSELTIAIVQLVASGRGVAALPYWAVLPYLEKGYVIAKPIGEQGLSSELYLAIRQNDTSKNYLSEFSKIIKSRSFKELPGLSRLSM